MILKCLLGMPALGLPVYASIFSSSAKKPHLRTAPSQRACVSDVCSIYETKDTLLNKPLELQDFSLNTCVGPWCIYICVCACFRGVYCEWSSVRLRIWNWFSINGSDFLKPARSKMYKSHHFFLKPTSDIFSFSWTLMVVLSIFWFAVWSIN